MRSGSGLDATMSSRILNPTVDKRGSRSITVAWRITKKPLIGSDSGVRVSRRARRVARTLARTRDRSHWPTEPPPAYRVPTATSAPPSATAR